MSVKNLGFSASRSPSPTPSIYEMAIAPMRRRAESWLIRAALLERGKFHKPINRTSWVIIILVAIISFLTFPLSFPFCIRIVHEYEKAVIFRLGRLLPGGAKGPGVFFVLPCVDSFQKIDMRVISLDVPPQQVLTSDSVCVNVDAVVYFHISDPTVSVTNVSDAVFSTRLLAQTTLRNILGTKTLTQILAERDSIASVIHEILDEGTYPWGVKVDRVEVKDIRLPVNLLRAMATEAEAARMANAKVTAANGEWRASRILSEAAQTIESAPATLYLRHLQTLQHISAEHNDTWVVPVPVGPLRRFIHSKLAQKLFRPQPSPKPAQTHSDTESGIASPVPGLHEDRPLTPKTFVSELLIEVGKIQSPE